jgi:hypothetical protein
MFTLSHIKPVTDTSEVEVHLWYNLLSCLGYKAFGQTCKRIQPLKTSCSILSYLWRRF